VLKLIKKSGFFLYSIPFKTQNFIRYVFSYPVKDIPLWKQKIPLHKLTSWFYENQFLKLYTHLHEKNLQKITLLAYDFWMLDHQLFDVVNDSLNAKKEFADILILWERELKPRFSELQKQIRECESEINAGFTEMLSEIDQMFDGQLDIAGTLEFKSFRYRKGKRIQQSRKLKKQYALTINKRNNTLFALADDWKFNQEIYILKGKSFKSCLLLQAKIRSRADVLGKGMNKIPVALSSIYKEIISDQPDVYRKNLLNLKAIAAKTLNYQLIPEITDLMLEQGFPMVIDETELSLVTELAQMTSNRILIEGFDPSKAYNDKVLQTVTPFEIVNYELMAKLKKVLLNVKIQTIENLEKTKNELDSLGRMVVFNLDSAIALLDEHGDASLNASLEDAKTSMERALKNYQELKGVFDGFIESLVDEYETSTLDFSAQLSELMDNSKVADIRYRITRAKALKKSEQIILDVKNFIKELYSKSEVWYRFSLRKIGSGINAIRDQLGIQQISGDISMEISDFLVSGSTSVQKLPFVYRRLFVNEPLKEMTFYLHRYDEAGKLETAFNKWKNGSFSPVLIYGEKGSGISTFVQLFVKEKIPQNPVVYSVQPIKRILSEEDLLAILGISFRAEAFGKLHELYDFAEKQEPFVAYFDKVHMLYLRQPGGFGVLKKFFEIISNTSRKIFWICTSGLYSSQFLHKSIGLYDYFPVLIPMKNLSREEVGKVILMRHKASGYGLIFKPSIFDLADRNFLRKNPLQQQEFLQEKYFQILNRLTQSNVTFALQLWLRSAKKTDDHTICLSSLESLDFSFMFNLPGEVVYGLHALLLHERLDVFQLSQVLNISRRQAYLLLMRLNDRGIIAEEKGFYAIHHLLYRQTINLLKDKNLIY
jgi:hypothetical protein